MPLPPHGGVNSSFISFFMAAEACFTNPVATYYDVMLYTTIYLDFAMPSW